MVSRPRRCGPILTSVALTIATAVGAAGGRVLAAEESGTRSASMRLRDVTDEAGIAFTHRHGGTGTKYYIETVPPGHCWLDFDSDGWMDVYMVQSGPLPGSPRGKESPHGRLYRNRGDGTFADVTRQAGVANAAGYAGC